MIRLIRSWQFLSTYLHLLLLISFAFLACGTLLTGRMVFTRSLNYLFLPFNLLLAALPIIFSILFTHTKKPARRVCFAALWLLFFPNAPYIITDLIHLTRIGGTNGAPLWFDVLLVASYAGAGLIFGYVSLLQMQNSIAANFPRANWGIAVLSCFLAGFRIYLGRFLRWHSVHLFLDPVPLLLDVLDRILKPAESPTNVGSDPRFRKSYPVRVLRPGSDGQTDPNAAEPCLRGPFRANFRESGVSSLPAGLERASPKFPAFLFSSGTVRGGDHEKHGTGCQCLHL